MNLIKFLLYFGLFLFVALAGVPLLNGTRGYSHNTIEMCKDVASEAGWVSEDLICSWEREQGFKCGKGYTRRGRE